MRDVRELRVTPPGEDEIERRLDAVRGWTWDPHTDRWEQAFDRLEAYVKHQGDARVPDAYKVDGYALGAWVGIQRASQRKGTLDVDRRRRLEQLPGWIWNALLTKTDTGRTSPS